MSEELAHHPLGASASDRWLNCPGSVLATKDLPDTDSEYSIEGTAAHSLAEMARQQGKPVKEYIGVQIPVELVDKSYQYVIVTPEMADHIQGFVDYLSALNGDDYNETRVYINEYVPGAFGTLDAAKVVKYVCNIIDLKYGQGVHVEAKENPQLMFYALGFYLTWGWLYEIDVFTLHVYQPRREHTDRWDISLKDLLHWAETVLKPGAILAMQSGAPFKAGEWCKFCKLRETCVTRAKHVFEMNLDELDDLDSAIAKDAPPLVTLTRDQIAAALRRKPLVIAWYSDIEKYAASEVKHGRPVGGFKFVAGKTSRDWAVPVEEVLKAMQEEFLDTTSMFTEPELITPPQAEKKYGKKTFAGDLKRLIHKSPGKPTLVPPENDKPALDISLVAELDDVAGEDFDDAA